jgi:hypothetical protein
MGQKRCSRGLLLFWSMSLLGSALWVIVSGAALEAWIESGDVMQRLYCSSCSLCCLSMREILLEAV